MKFSKFSSNTNLGIVLLLFAFVPQFGAEGVWISVFTAISAFCNAAGMARQKFPERVVVMPDFPRTPSGKIRKDQLRRALRENAL